MANTDWPKLSETLTHPKAPNVCQSCGLQTFDLDSPLLHRWEECDERDRKTGVIVVLCKRCAERIVEPHPRLYSCLATTEPFPGSNGICVDCPHRSGTRCSHPLAKANGGPGVMLTVTKPIRAHVQRSPRRLSGFVTLWPKPPSDCKQKHEAPL